jgi:hypothetical protein
LPGAEGSPEFNREYEDILKQHGLRARSRHRLAPHIIQRAELREALDTDSRQAVVRREQALAVQVGRVDVVEVPAGGNSLQRAVECPREPVERTAEPVDLAVLHRSSFENSWKTTVGRSLHSALSFVAAGLTE